VFQFPITEGHVDLGALARELYLEEHEANTVKWASRPPIGKTTLVGVLEGVGKAVGVLGISLFLEGL
jgi:hypothetical protein